MLPHVKTKHWHPIKVTPLNRDQKVVGGVGKLSPSILKRCARFA